jgi:hypothetical protein
MSENNKIISWIHYTMTSSMPVQLCDIFFREEDVLLLYYSRHTLVTMAMKIPKRNARMMKIILSTEGLESARNMADREITLNYEDIEEVTLIGGSKKNKNGRNIPFLPRLRPRITIKAKGKLYTYGIHDKEFDYERTKNELEKLAREKGFRVIVK